MLFQELLALGERIGNVSTGLSEEIISGCLQEITHCQSNQFEDDQEEGKCAICLVILINVWILCFLHKAGYYVYTILFREILRRGLIRHLFDRKSTKTKIRSVD